MTRDKPGASATDDAYGIYVGTKPDAPVEGAITISWADDLYGPQMKWYDGKEWLPLNPDPVSIDEDDMKKIRVLKPKYIQSRYPTKSERRRTREEGLREQREGLKSEVEVLKAKLAALEPGLESISRLPNPSVRKLRF